MKGFWTCPIFISILFWPRITGWPPLTEWWPVVGTRPKTPRAFWWCWGELGAEMKARERSGVDSDCGGRKSIWQLGILNFMGTPFATIGFSRFVAPRFLSSISRGTHGISAGREWKESRRSSRGGLSKGGENNSFFSSELCWRTCGIRTGCLSAFSINFFVLDDKPENPEVFLFADNMFGVTGILLVNGSGFSKNFARSVLLQHFAISTGVFWNLFLHLVEAPSLRSISARIIRSWSNRPSSHQASPQVCSKPVAGWRSHPLGVTRWPPKKKWHPFKTCWKATEPLLRQVKRRWVWRQSLRPTLRSPRSPRPACFAKTSPYQRLALLMSPVVLAGRPVSWKLEHE